MVKNFDNVVKNFDNVNVPSTFKQLHYLISTFQVSSAKLERKRPQVGKLYVPSRELNPGINNYTTDPSDLRLEPGLSTVET